MTYDYIVVGAGSAGCVLASRLTEDPATSVLLIEAGGNDDLALIHIPAEAPNLIGSTIDWGYTTMEEPYLHHKRVNWPRGKVLGGSSSINFMAYVRGNHADYDHWQALGNPGWSYVDVLPYFKKSENYASGASDYHGVDGPLNVMQLPSQPATNTFIEAGVELGCPHNEDYNGECQEGFGPLQSTQYQGRRSSTADGYLHPVMDRPNLTVWTDTLVTRVLFAGSRAIGVAYLKDGVEQETQVNKEVILSGGSINSPQLLMLSGVGPADHLRSLDIPVVADVAGVGSNLHDHLTVFMHYQTRPSASQFSNASEGVAFISEGVAFIKTQPELADPDIQIIFLPCLFPAGLAGKGYTVVVIPTYPQSRGRLMLRSKDPAKYPALLANYLAEPADVETFVRGVKMGRKLSRTKAFAPFNEKETDPGPRIQSDQEIAEYIRGNASSMCHPVGTCKMGHDPMAVVDEQLRVRDIEGLRVVDASIMPTIIHGNTNAGVIMIAEKIADLIKQNLKS